MNNNNNFMPGFYDDSSTSRENDNPDDNLLHLRPSGSGNVAVEKEHMFDKVVTPSDVGKLNRLVIPKQHAEKYFPLDSSTNEKGLLLNFEDRNGKPWRFRYSYWNSSQSYVMTKGWSRFVKEKKLDAGDIVSFQRGVGEKDRLFIDWRRRPDAPDLPVPHHFSTFYRSSGNPWNPLFLTPQTYANQVQYHQYQNQNPYGIGYGSGTVVNGNPCPPGSIFYLRPGGNVSGGGVGVGGGIVVAGQPRQDVGERMVYESVPVVHGKAAAKRLRLFGVNMDCQVSESDECEVPMRLHQYFPLSPSSSSSVPNSLGNNEEDKGKSSMSLDLDI